MTGGNEPTPVRSLLLNVDIGAGHRMAAEALASALREARPGSDHHLVEALDYVGPDAGRLARDLYFGALAEAPELWGEVYQQGAELGEAMRSASEAVDDLRSAALGVLARELRPDVIVAMHPIAVGLGASVVRLDEEVGCPLVAVVTDFDAHPLWIARGVDLYLVATRRVASGLVARGLPSGTVAATGIPLRRPFGTIREGGAARRPAELDPARLTILLLGGGLGLGPIAETARRLSGLEGPVQLAVIAGRNAELEAEACRIAAGSRVPVIVRGQVEEVWDWVAAADLAVGKPGGLTSAELLAAGVPLVALAPIPGQERANCEALVADGAAVEAGSPEEAFGAVAGLLAAPTRLESMRTAALALGRPGAARDAARRVLSLVDDARAGVRPQRAESPVDALARAGRAALTGLDEMARESGISKEGIVRPAHDASRAVASGLDDLARAAGLEPREVIGSLSRLGKAAAEGLDDVARDLGLADDEEK